MVRSSSLRTVAATHMRLEGDHPLHDMRMTSPHCAKGEAGRPDQRWFKSHATTFAKYGIYPGQGIQGLYMRDRNTGVWYKDNPDRLWHKEMQAPKQSPVCQSNMNWVSVNHANMTIKHQPF
ncbi:unnamed protein product [Polarella glacialis]|nr:unnamed protein product [Polarella glacialis]